MYDLDRDIPQDDTEAGRRMPIPIGIGIGLTLGIAIGCVAGDPTAFPFGGDDLECLMPVSGDPGACATRDDTFRTRITACYEETELCYVRYFWL